MAAPSRVDQATIAFRRVLAEANSGEQARVDALVVLSQRTVYVATWPGQPSAARTLTNSHGESALPLFTGLDVLDSTATRFGWRHPDGSLPFRELGAREALRHALARSVHFVVIDIGCEHSVEFAREELEPLVPLQARASGSGPYAATGERQAALLDAVRRTSNRPPRSPLPAQPPAGHALPLRDSQPNPMPAVRSPSPPAPAPQAQAQPQQHQPMPSTRPRVAPLSPPKPTPAVHAPTGEQPIAARQAVVPNPPPPPLAARLRTPTPVQIKHPSQPGHRPPTPPEQKPVSGPRPVIQDIPQLAPANVQAPPPAPAAPPPAAPRNDEPTLAERTGNIPNPLAVQLPDMILQGISVGLRGFPEVEWACVMSDGSDIPLIGVRVDPSFLNRVADITDAIMDVGDKQELALQVLLLNNQELVKNARKNGRAFYPWRR